MIKLKYPVAVFVAFIGAASALWGAGGVGARGAYPVCPDPSAPCKSKHKEFSPDEMPFRLPAKIKPNTVYESAPFWGVVLMTGMDTPCDEGETSSNLEKARREVQRQFPRKKAFADPQCPNMDAVFYTMNGKTNHSVGSFLAVYGGATKQDALRVREKLKGKYPRATVHRMTVGWSQIVQ